MLQNTLKIKVDTGITIRFCGSGKGLKTLFTECTKLLFGHIYPFFVIIRPFKYEWTFNALSLTYYTFAYLVIA